MATKWEVNRAVRASALPPPSRLIMLVLSDIAEAGTAEVPAQRTPSLAVLAKETGLNEATVKRHLIALDDAGWLKRTKPTQDAARRLGERTRYQLLVPIGVGADSAQGSDEDEEQGAESAQGRAHSAPNQGAEEAQSGRTARPIDKEDDQDDRDDHSSSSAKPPRPEVERICAHLADRMIANGCKPPTIGKRWRAAARLLLDKDGRTEDQVIRAIDWATSDEFWRANILSLPTLRDKYDQLRLAADRQRKAGQHAGPASTAPAVIPADERCPNHPGQRAATCRVCASESKGAPRR